MDFSNFDINSFLKEFALSVVPFLFAITVHEVMHGYVAYRLGDNTAKDAGRLTLNPLSHIDPVGLLFLLVTRMFGWAKPVPVNFMIVSRHKYGIAMVSVAGPLSNLTLAVVSALLFHSFQIIVNDVPYSVAYPISMMLIYSVRINIALAVFNMLPIMPFDGGRIVYNFLPRDLADKFEVTERYGFIIILLLFMSGAIGYILTPPVQFLFKLLIY